jgi:hypothetical protein
MTVAVTQTRRSPAEHRGSRHPREHANVHRAAAADRHRGLSARTYERACRRQIVSEVGAPSPAAALRACRNALLRAAPPAFVYGRLPRNTAPLTGTQFAGRLPSHSTPVRATGEDQWPATGRWHRTIPTDCQLTSVRNTRPRQQAPVTGNWGLPTEAWSRSRTWASPGGTGALLAATAPARSLRVSATAGDDSDPLGASVAESGPSSRPIRRLHAPTPRSSRS